MQRKVYLSRNLFNLQYCKKMDIKSEVKQTMDSFLDVKIKEAPQAAAQTAAAIDQAIGGVTGFIYKAGRSFTIQNHIQRYSMPVPMDGHGQRLIAEFLVPTLQQYCQSRGQAHISKYQSTKHH